MIEKILLADDSQTTLKLVADFLISKNFTVSTACDGEEAIKKIKYDCFDLIITDMKMPKKSGLDVIRYARQHSPKTIIVIITAYGSIESAVETMSIGAFHYLVKPFSPENLIAIINKANEHISLLEENNFLRNEIQKSDTDNDGFIAESSIMKQILEYTQKAAKSNASIFISGESGTGKEVLANFIHNNSNRSDKNFVRVNCAAIPETLIESEFFGHEKGSFTGANSRRIGRFEFANGGTLLLDEVTEIPAMLQPKLLRAIQEREIERVGGNKTISFDARFISTSNRDISQAIKDNIFREDLFYRLNVIPIHLPPLRDRNEDIVPLANYFINKFCIENHKQIKELTPSAQRKLLEYQWPGNIRELGNIIERTVVLDLNQSIKAEHIMLEHICF